MRETFLSHVVKAILIWLITNLLSSLIYAVMSRGNENVGIVLLIGALFSSPAILLLVPVLYSLRFASTRTGKMVLGTGMIFLLCCLIVAPFFLVLDINPFRQVDVILFLSPYLLSAWVSFFLVTRKMPGHQSLTKNLSRLIL